MDALLDLLNSLIDVGASVLDVIFNLLRVVVPWLPLLTWMAFWSLAVNWSKALPILRRGGFLGVLLLMFVAVLVWGSVAPPEGGHHSMLGLTVSNFTGKVIYVTFLTCIALLCGSAQLSGAFGRLAVFPDELPADDHGHDHHGHDDHHGGHGHASDHQGSQSHAH